MYLPNLETLYNSIFYYRNSTIVIRITINYHTMNNRHLTNAKRKKRKNQYPPSKTAITLCTHPKIPHRIPDPTQTRHRRDSQSQGYFLATPLFLRTPQSDHAYPLHTCPERCHNISSISLPYLLSSSHPGYSSTVHPSDIKKKEKEKHLITLNLTLNPISLYLSPSSNAIPYRCPTDIKKKKKTREETKGRKIKRSIVKPSRRVLAFYCSAGDGGSQQAAWWEASIKVSGRLIVIQSGGRLRYQFPVRPRSFPLRVSSLRFFSLSHSFSLSLRSSCSARVSRSLRLLLPS